MKLLRDLDKDGFNVDGPLAELTALINYVTQLTDVYAGSANTSRLLCRTITKTNPHKERPRKRPLTVVKFWVPQTSRGMDSNFSAAKFCNHSTTNFCFCSSISTVLCAGSSQ